MEITIQTKIAELLEEYPNLEDTLIELSPTFIKLRNPILRRTVAKVASIQQAAQIADISPVVMVQTLRKAAGFSTISIDEILDNDGEEQNQPEWFNEANIFVRFDASHIINAGQSPMQDIIQLAASLRQGEIMKLITPFKPVPIMDILKSKNFDLWNRNNNTYITPKLR